MFLVHVIESNHMRNADLTNYLEVVKTWILLIMKLNLPKAIHLLEGG